MASIVWPTSLPQKLRQQGYIEQQPDLMIRTESDVGTAQQRRRGTAGPTRIDGSQLLTESQVETLIDFYRNTLVEGTDKFEWQHPRTGDTVEMRFRGRPEIESPSGSIYTVNYRLEILP